MNVSGRGVYLFGFVIPIFVGPSRLSFDAEHIELRVRLVGTTPLRLNRGQVAAVRQGPYGGGMVFFELEPAGMHRWGIKPYWSGGGSPELLSQLSALGWPVDEHTYLKMRDVSEILRAPERPPPAAPSN